MSFIRDILNNSVECFCIFYFRIMWYVLEGDLSFNYF